MMVSFYFKEVKNDNNDIQDMQYRNEDYAIEFLHKSLMEYMVSLYIYESIKKSFLKKDEDEEYIICENKNALENLWNVSYKKEITHEIQNNIEEQSYMKKNQTVKRNFLKDLIHFFLIL
jgi:hypothetical protein